MHTPRAVHIPLSNEVADALYRLSRREYRHPRQQAAFLLEESLRRAGAMEASGHALTIDQLPAGAAGK